MRDGKFNDRIIFMSDSKQNKLPSKSSLLEQYKIYRSGFETILNTIEYELRDTITLASKPTLKSRVKSFDSYYRKVLRVKPEINGDFPLPLLTDMMGIRIICAFLEDLTVVEQQIKDNFVVKEIERKGASLSFKEFGYESVHILVEIPKDILSAAACTGFNLPRDCVCEIQIRTILQDAWAEVEHELIYKSEFSPFDLPLKRKLASINASLSLADIIFQEIRDYQNKLNREIDFRRNAFYSKADSIARDSFPTDDVHHENTQQITSPYVRGTIDDMLLAAIQCHNAGEMEKAVKIYTDIVESKPTPNNVILSVILKHRGMAFFAQNKYDEALNDFQQSVSYQPENFRSLYYIGIVYSVQGDNEKAIDFFNQSLMINEHQSHVYYRRALANYNLSNYIEASSDLATANSMGLDDDDCRHLQECLMKKFDMNM